MANRFCVIIDKQDYPVNPAADVLRFCTSKPERIGDDAVVVIKGDSKAVLRGERAGLERKVRYLRSTGMVKDGTYLVDLESREAWPYELK